jgi:uncharacterized protein (DUF1330 family)
MNLEHLRLARDYGLAVDDEGDVPALRAAGDGPIVVVNFFALNETAHYEDGPPCPGLEAMLRYSAVSGDRLAAAGGHFVAQALSAGAVWGTDDDWDLVVVARYPGVDAFWALLADPAYREAYVHRRAAVARQRVTVGAALD